MRTVIITLSMAAAAALGTQLQTLRISVDDPRPLASAAVELEKQYGWIITYEDPYYEYSGDLVDVAATVRRDHDTSKPVWIPRGGRFEFQRAVTDPRPDPDDVLTALVDSFNASGHVGEFRMLHNGDVFHIVPAISNDQCGLPQPRRSRLDPTITLSAGDRNVLDQLHAILQALSQTLGTRIGVGTVPTNALAQTPAPAQPTSDAARSMILRALASTQRKLSWQLFCGPDGPIHCALNIHMVRS